MGRKCVKVADALIEQFLKTGHRIAKTEVVEGLPADARLVRCGYDGRHVIATFESETWPDVVLQEPPKPWPDIEVHQPLGCIDVTFKELPPFEVARLPEHGVKPGDILVLRCPGRMSEREYTSIKEQVEVFFQRSIKVLILEENISIEAIFHLDNDADSAR